MATEKTDAVIGGVGAAGLYGRLPGVRDDVDDIVDIILNEEIKAPILVDSGLPEILAFIVLLGTKGWVPEILL